MTVPDAATAGVPVPSPGSVCNPSGVRSQWERWGLDASVVAALAAGTLAQASVAFDLTDADEANYFDFAVSGDTSQTAASWGPAYGLVFRVLLAVTGDRIDTAVYARTVTSLVLVLGVWLAVRLVAGSRPALVVAAPLPWLGITYLWPSIGGLAAGLAVVSVAVAARRPTAVGLGGAAAVMWLAAMTRGELWPAAVAATVLALWRVGSDVRAARSAVRWGSALTATGLAVGVPGVAVAIYGWLWGPETQVRLGVAFGQHYALAQSGPGLPEPWGNWLWYIERDFGGALSPQGLIAANPGALVGHALGNVGRAPGAFVDDALLAIGTPLRGAAVAFLVATLLVALLVPSRRWRVSRAQVVRNARRPAVLIALVALATAFGQMVAIYPRAHYWVLVLALGLLLLGIAIRPVVESGLRTRGRPRAPAIALISGAALLAASGVIHAGAQTLAAGPDRPYATAMRALTACSQGARIYSNAFGPQVYVPQLVEVAPTAASGRVERGALAAWLADNDLDAVYLSPSLEGAWPEGAWDAFTDDPEDFGFARVQVGDRGEALFPQGDFFVGSSGRCAAAVDLA